jgi:hypothetical protein
MRYTGAKVKNFFIFPNRQKRKPIYFARTSTAAPGADKILAPHPFAEWEALGDGAVRDQSFVASSEALARMNASMAGA